MNDVGLLISMTLSHLYVIIHELLQYFYFEVTDEEICWYTDVQNSRLCTELY